MDVGKDARDLVHGTKGIACGLMYGKDNWTENHSDDYSAGSKSGRTFSNGKFSS